MVRKNSKVHFIEVVRDEALEKKEPEATAAVRRFFPGCPPVKLYRAADGRIGFQLQLSVTAGQRKRLEDAYRAVMKVLGERRGRPRGEKTVQTKLLLPEPIYRALKEAAADSNATMSNVVAGLARRELLAKDARLASRA
jgi:hypothetical protein